MGSGASKQAPRGLVISFDAPGTLYRFKRPAPQQFLSVAKQCGYKGKTTHEELNSSYLAATRYMQDQRRNYGKMTLASTEEWWAELARHALRVPDTQKVPGNLGPSLYKHFSSVPRTNYSRMSSLSFNIYTVTGKHWTRKGRMTPC